VRVSYEDILLNPSRVAPDWNYHEFIERHVVTGRVIGGETLSSTSALSLLGIIVSYVMRTLPRGAANIKRISIRGETNHGFVRKCPYERSSRSRAVRHSVGESGVGPDRPCAAPVIFSILADKSLGSALAAEGKHLA